MNHLKINNEKDLKEYIEEFKFTFKCPKLFISNYFSKTRTEVDISAEKLLGLNVNSTQIYDKINNNRIAIINEINSFEEECLLNLKKNSIKDKSLVDDLNESIKVIDNELDNKYDIKKHANYVFRQYNKLKTHLFLNKGLIFTQRLTNDSFKSDNTWFGILILIDDYLDEYQIDYHFDFYK